MADACRAGFGQRSAAGAVGGLRWKHRRSWKTGPGACRRSCGARPYGCAVRRCGSSAGRRRSRARQRSGRCSSRMRAGAGGARAVRLVPLRLHRAFGGAPTPFRASELRGVALGRRHVPPAWGQGVYRGGRGPVGDASPAPHACGSGGQPASREGLGWPLLLLAIDWRLVLFLWAVPVAMTFWAGGLVTMVCHRWGSRPHTAGDDSRNNPLATLLSWGEDWHNSHHADPGKSVFHPWLDVGGAMTGCLDMLQSSSGRNSLSISSRKHAFGTFHLMELPRGRPDRTRKSAQVGGEIALLNYSLWYAHVWIRHLGLSLCGRETCYLEGATAYSRWTAGNVTGGSSQDAPAQRSPHITLKLDRCKHFKTAGRTRKLKRPSRTVVSRVSHYAGIVMSTYSDIRNGQ